MARPRSSSRKTGKGRKKQGGVSLAGIFLFLLGVACTLVVVAVVLAGWLVFAPAGPSRETFVEIPQGSSTSQMAARLEQAGIIRSRWAFELVRAVEHGRLVAGEYRFDHPVPVTEVYARIHRGDVFARVVMVPEGANMFDIANRLAAANVVTREDFLAVAQSGALVSDLDPKAVSLEGYLFPDTYKFPHNATAEQVAATMVRRFRQVAGQLGLAARVHETVTMASLIERETAVADERPLVASVFENRLHKNMALMTDPAVIYGLELAGRWRGAIYKSDLSTDTPFNTYLHKGLPPGPVANPGVRSLKAAMQPAATDYLYFVAAGTDPSEHSRFAATLAEHNRNVEMYRAATSGSARKAGGL